MTAEAIVQVSLQERQMSKQSVQTAEQLKAEGNQAFKGAGIGPSSPPPPPPGRHVPRAQPPPVSRCRLADKHYAHAQQLYSKAIEADPTNAVLYGNRAFAAIRLEVRCGWLSRSCTLVPFHGTLLQ